MGFDGRFAWHELRTGDVEADTRFYGDLLGWTFAPNPAGVTILAGGGPIGGVSPVKPGVPVHWNAVVACADVDGAAAAARAGGGVITTGEPVEMPGMGRIAPILDPDKAIFAAITPGPGVPEPSPRTGAFVWERLRTPDPAAAATFYGAAFGWTARLSDDASGGVFELPDGTRVAEVLRTPPGAPMGWLPFVLVDDVDAVRAYAAQLGGTADEPVTVAGIGRFSVITDPKGAMFAAHQAA
ncbi:MAG TPA: VOC family protein [Streptosporangiaceae bacterium]|jgi:hypothetical protein